MWVGGWMSKTLLYCSHGSGGIQSVCTSSCKRVSTISKLRSHALLSMARAISRQSPALNGRRVDVRLAVEVLVVSKHTCFPSPAKGSSPFLSLEEHSFANAPGMEKLNTFAVLWGSPVGRVPLGSTCDEQRVICQRCVSMGPSHLTCSLLK